MSIRVLLADDHRLFLEGLTSLLSGEKGISVVATATNGLEALKAVRKVPVNVAVLDISMPGLNGLETTRRITAEFPEVRIICVSMHGGAEFVVPALERGASGYLLKECASDELVHAIRSVSRGLKYLSPSVTEVAVSGLMSRRPGTVPDRHGLTPREQEVLQLIAEGLTTKEAARELSISVKTVATHRANILQKVGARSTADLTRFAIQHQIIPSPRESQAKD